MGGINDLLPRLAGVRANGPDKWVAKCPAHADKTPSLAIRAMADGRLLVHCFAGCGAADVVESVGLTVSDLFPERLPDLPRIRAPFTAFDALVALKSESALVAFAASDCADGTMTPETAARVAVAAGRIATALEYTHDLG